MFSLLRAQSCKYLLRVSPFDHKHEAAQELDTDF
jgi:hypothetical protein